MRDYRLEPPELEYACLCADYPCTTTAPYPYPGCLPCGDLPVGAPCLMENDAGDPEADAADDWYDEQKVRATR